MIFDQTWMAELLDLQRKAAELKQGKNPADGVQDLVMEVLNKWGITNLPWNENLESMRNLWTKGTSEPQQGADWNIDISERKTDLLIKVLIPGIEDKRDLLVKLQGDILHIAGKSSYVDNDGGVFSRKIQLPVEVTALGAGASYQDDNLTISLPKRISEIGEVIPLNFFQTK